jgi:aldose 1-epimerase
VFAPSALSAPAGAPAPRGDFVCLEPMAGISNAMNLAHKGLYQELQYIAPGETWTETFRVRPTGF